MACIGIGDAQGGHCCWVHGEVCRFLLENHEGRRFACGLRVELGDWDKVHADPRYRPIALVFVDEGLCGDWQPQANVCCNEAR
jgi:hypothetical protein